MLFFFFLSFLPACFHPFIFCELFSSCVFVFVFFSLRCQCSSTTSESLSTCEHELVSSSLTVATLPLLVLTRRRSQSLTSEISAALGEKDSTRDRPGHRSDSFHSLNFGKIPSMGPRSPQGVPRIIVISPTSESSLITHDSVCLEDSVEALENNVFVSLNFSSEVFEAVELLS